MTNLLIVKFTVAPGGVFGWHQHGDPVWAVIQSGTWTLYQGDDPSSQGKEYGPGSALTFMLPEGGAARIDVPAPGNCPF